MEKVQELKDTRDEIQSLLSTATRPRVKKLLQDELALIEREIDSKEKRTEHPNDAEKKTHSEETSCGANKNYIVRLGPIVEVCENLHYSSRGGNSARRECFFEIHLQFFGVESAWTERQELPISDGQFAASNCPRVELSES